MRRDLIRIHALARSAATILSHTGDLAAPTEGADERDRERIAAEIEALGDRLFQRAQKMASRHGLTVQPYTGAVVPREERADA